MSGAMEEALEEFTSECDEMLERVTLALADIEKQQHDDDTLNSVYRDVHTIKGSSQLFGFQSIGKIGHAMEACLDPLRKGLATISSDQVRTLYQSIDIISRLLAGIKEKGEEPEAGKDLLHIIPQLVELTTAAFGGTPNLIPDEPMPVGRTLGINPDDADRPAEAAPVPEPAASAAQATQTPAMPEEAAADRAAPTPVADTAAETPKAAAETPKAAAETPKAAAETPKAAAETPKAAAETPKAAETAVGTNTAAEEDPADDAGEPQVSTMTVVPAQKEGAAGKKSTDPQDTIRVQVGILDNLMNLIGELVLIRNQIIQFSSTQAHPEYSNLSQAINVVTSELQNEVMKTRMQPIGNILSKFHRVVRDLSRDLNKSVELLLSGVETELDKTLIEAIKDPLTHIVRNSVDHGIESPDVRKSAGKPEKGTINIRAQHESGQVVVEIEDDGAGLNRSRLLNKAIEKGVISEEKSAGMPDRDVYQLIFSPGFSTAAKVTNVSGRGVGMDVVKTNIEQIGGLVDITSVEGKGTTLRLRIPLTLAIVPALIVRSRDQQFAIPQVKLVELLRLENDGGSPIETVQNRPVYRLRGNLLPLLSLRELLAHHAGPAVDDEAGQPEQSATTNVVVLKAGSHHFGLVVDEIVDSADIVVKPLTGFLKFLSVFSGATVLGDGSVALTLDVQAIAEIGQIDNEESTDQAQETPADEADSDFREFLLVDINGKTGFAIELEQVNRLEEFHQREIEYSGEQQLIKYRNSVLPILDVRKALQLPPEEGETSETFPVVVVQKNRRLFGLRVKGILDILTSNGKIDSRLKDRPGISGNLIHEERIIVVLDTDQIIKDVSKDFSIEYKSPQVREIETLNRNRTNRRSDHTLLCVEDSKFFRKQLVRILENAGFNILQAEHGANGIDIMKEHGEGVSLIISDIEMPVMNGFEFAEKIQKHESWKKIPMIAVTTRFRKQDIEKGETCGFRQYLEKLDEKVLVKSVDSILNIDKEVS